MRVKRYVVDTMPDALQQIRGELGNDAVILSTKDIRFGGFLGLFSKKKIEVIAATDTQEMNKSSTHEKKEAPKEPFKSTIAKQSAAKAYHESSAGARPSSLKMPYVPDVIEQEEQVASTEVQPEFRTAATPVKQEVPSTKPISGLDDQLVNEIRQMKDMMRSFTGSLPKSERPPALEIWAGRLEGQDLLPVLIEEILNQVQQQAADVELITEEWVGERIRDYLLKLIGDHIGSRISSEVQVIQFVGPTGVGKTTTIAKLAAEQVLKSHRKVGFITSDTYRIAAVEQLRTYANILNVPIEVVFSPQDLPKAFDRMEDADLIFMDTAGRNFRNEMYVSELNALLKNRGSSESILVLSLTNKYKDMKVITENFLKYGVNKVLFTKMDETATCGAILNLLYEYPVQLSYITNGQNVPEDIKFVTDHELTSWIMEDLWG